MSAKSDMWWELIGRKLYDDKASPRHLADEAFIAGNLEGYAAGVAAERERAAGIADDMAHGYSHGLTRDEYEVLTDCAAAIRRGE